jgi:non-specific serine/threonine protein kinase/serine/threonine-protein kinase
MTDQQGPQPPAPATATDGGAAARPKAAPEGPRYLGPYRLLHSLGEGGMGQVWLADQDEPVRRKVAVKVIKAGMDTKQVVARFESERQALALMNHAAIAKVFDGGSTPEGRPYFVMEYVAGISLTEHCDRHKLDTKARLELLCEICAGVQHAHQKAVIHRDLKPSNILITLADDKPQPKIIDFGIAKATGQRLTDHTLQTALGAVVGTPEYMSPEQADPTGQDVDTRSDVYSLGVILYELLTGELPFGAKELRTANPVELQRKLREEDPPRPSVRVSKPSPQTQSAAKNRGTEQPVLRSLLKGDLDAITMKALEKQRSRRYGTPTELAEDLQRYLRQEPVLAQPPSAAYRTRKYVQRNKPLVTGVLAVFVSLVAGVVVSASQAQRARAAERLAASEAAAARATSEFLQKDLLGQADVAQQEGAGGKADPDIKVRTLLDRAAAKVEGRFTGQPEVEAAIRGTIGEAYQGLGLYPEAHLQLSRALEVSGKSLGAGHPQTLAAAAALADLETDEGSYPQAEALLQQTLEGQRRALGPEHPATLRTLVALGRVAYGQGKRPEAQAAFTRALELQRRALGPEHRETLATLRLLANTYTVSNQPDAALALYRQVLEAQRRTLGPEHPDTLATMGGLSIFFSNFERPVEAVALLEEFLPIARRVFGREHPRTLSALLTLARVDLQAGKFAGAEAAAREVHQARSKVLGPDHPQTLEVLALLGVLYFEWGRYALAEETSRKAWDTLARTAGPESVRSLDAEEGVAAAVGAQGRLAAAAALLEQVVEMRRRTQGPDYRDTLLSATSLAALRAEQGRLDEAAAQQTGLLETTTRVLGAGSIHMLGLRTDLGQTLCWKGDYARAGPLLAETAALARRARGPDHPATLAALQAGGACALREGKPAEAAALLGEALAGRRTRLGDGHPLTQETAVDLALALHAQGKFDEGAALARTALAEGEKARPEAWQTSFARSVLGACLAGERKAAEARPLLRAGVQGMEAQRERIPVPLRERLEWARERLRALEKP